MVHKPAVNVIIAGGSTPDLFECLLSLYESTYAPCQTLVVDNSPDGLSDEFAQAFPDEHVARPRKSLTFAQAVNFGFRHALERGARLGFLLNDDVTVHPKTLSMLAEAEERRGPGVYAPEVWPYESGAPRMRFRIDWAKRLVVTEVAAANPTGEIDYAEGSAVLISAEVFERLGGFDEGLGFYYEDADFSIRAKDAGFPVVEIPGARVWHKGSVSAGKGLSPFKAYWRARNALKFAAKHRSRAHLRANALYHFSEFVIPEALHAACRALHGSRRDTKVLAAIMRGTVDWLLGDAQAAAPRASADAERAGYPLPQLR